MIEDIGTIADIGPDNWPDYVDLSMEEVQKMAIDAYVKLKNHITELPIDLHSGDRDTLGGMHHRIYGAFCRLYGLNIKNWEEFVARLDTLIDPEDGQNISQIYKSMSEWVETQRK
jgi:hypothetical protein